jgi:hypothetical protein
MSNDRIKVGRGPEISEFIRRLGLDPTLTKRVIVDIPCDDVVKVYVEGFGDCHAFEIEPPGPMQEARIYSHGDIREYIPGPDGQALDITATAKEADR